MLNNKTLVISAFPAVGKSYLFDNAEELGIVVYDSDSSTFDKKDFPTNYIEHIQNLIDDSEKKIVMVSSHEEVREALIENSIAFTLVYPSIELKEEFLTRYKDRGSEQSFIDMMEDNFDSFVESCQEHGDIDGVNAIEITEPNTYLSDILDI